MCTFICLITCRAGVMGIWELLLMPLQHASLVDGVGSRWINAKHGKYAKYIAHFLDKCEKYGAIIYTRTVYQNIHTCTCTYMHIQYVHVLALVFFETTKEAAYVY